MKIYIAGPYTKGDVAQNVKLAISEGDYVARLGHIPFIPHLTHFWHMLHPHEYQFWIEQDLEWLKACDAILRLPGESAGADHEVEVAQQMGMTVYHTVFDIPRLEKTILLDTCITCEKCGQYHSIYFMCPTKLSSLP